MTSFTPLVVHCGASNLCVAVFDEQSDGKHMLSQLISEELDYDISSDDDWLSATIVTLKEIVENNKLKGKSATLVLPGFRLLTKSIKIPHVDESQRAQIIAFEAQQNIPYPLHEVVWDSEIVGDDGIETDCLFIAVKNDFILSFVNQLFAIGLNIQQVTAASILDYNAVKASLGDASDNKLLINVGARASNLIFFSENGFFIRNISLGGNSLTQQIADSMGVSFNKAESFKVKFFSGAESFAEDDPHVKMVLGCAQQFMQRMSTEITRSVVNYRRQNKGKSLEGILLTGRGSLLSGFSEYLAEKQKVSIDYFDPIDSIKLSDSLAANDKMSIMRFQLSEIVGVASHAQLESPAFADLLPQHIQAERVLNKQKPLVLAGLSCLAVASFLPFVSMSGAADALERNQLAYSQATPAFRATSDEISAIQAEAELVAEKISKLETLTQSRFNWIFFFDELQASLNSVGDTWLDDLFVDRTQVVETVESSEEFDDFGNPLVLEKLTTNYSLTISGRILLRDDASRALTGDTIDPRAISNRLRSLTNELIQSEFFLNASDPEIDFSVIDEGLNLLPFKVTLNVDPNRPL